MAAQRRKERTEAEGRSLLVRRIGVDTSPRDFVRFFAQADFHVESLNIGLVLGDSFGIASLAIPEAEARLQLANGETTEAQKWADGRFWRGQNLEVEVEGESASDQTR